MDYPKEELKAANKRAAAHLSRTPTAVAAHYDSRTGRLVVDLNTGLQIAFKPQDAQGLEEAQPEQLAKIEISPSGLGLHFPDLDADLYLPGLLEGLLGSKKWLAALLGQTGGRSTSAAKAAAARLNGRKGGRPKKKTANPDVAEEAI